MKRIAKLNDVAFHLINKVNKKKLKINTLLIKNWEKIFGENHNKVKIKKITFLGKDNLLNFEFSIDSCISFELHTQMEIIKLKCEELVGQKVNKILFSSIKELYLISKSLKKEREEKGSIFFNKEEIRFDVDKKGNPVEYKIKRQKFY